MNGLIEQYGYESNPPSGNRTVYFSVVFKNTPCVVSIPNDSSGNSVVFANLAYIVEKDYFRYQSGNQNGQTWIAKGY